MNLQSLRWTLPPVFVVAGLLMAFKGVTAVRLAACAASALVWYALSRRKARSLDRDRLAGGRLGRRTFN